MGAGAGGLAAAVLLARDFDVTVFERAAAPGGKIRQMDVGGGLIDAGPTVFTMRWVFEELFAAAGASFSEAVQLKSLHTIARHFWRDGSSLDLSADRQQSADAIGAFAGSEEAQNFLRFCDQTRHIYETLQNPFMRASKPSLTRLVVQRNPLALIGINPFETMWTALTKRFRDPRLRQLFARYATYCGSSPFAAPATLMLIAHVEQEGVWVAENGMQSLAQAIADVAERNGAVFRYESHIAKILLNDRRISGVALSSGEAVAADVVLFNGDPGALTAGLLGGTVCNAIKKPHDTMLSQSAITFAMRAHSNGDDLSVHNVFFAEDYRSEFDAVFGERRLPQTPTTYVFAPDRLDNTESGSDERLFCLVNAPPTTNNVEFDEKELELCRTRMIDHLKTCGFELQPVGTVASTSPTDFAAMFPGSRGALYGMANHGWRAAFQRPGVRTRLKGLYLAGGGVHPGPGVPMATLSGMAAAAVIKADCALT